MFDPITGNEIQIGNGQVTIHDGDNVSERTELLIQRIQSTFKDEVDSHKILRLNFQRGSKTLFVNAGAEDGLYNDVRAYIEKIIKDDYYPLTFNYAAFVSYSPLELVEESE